MLKSVQKLKIHPEQQLKSLLLGNENRLDINNICIINMLKDEKDHENSSHCTFSLKVNETHTRQDTRFNQEFLLISAEN